MAESHQSDVTYSSTRTTRWAHDSSVCGTGPRNQDSVPEVSSRGRTALSGHPGELYFLSRLAVMCRSFVLNFSSTALCERSTVVRSTQWPTPLTTPGTTRVQAAGRGEEALAAEDSRMINRSKLWFPAHIWPMIREIRTQDSWICGIM